MILKKNSNQKIVILAIMKIRAEIRNRKSIRYLLIGQSYTYRVLQTIQMKLTLLWVWAERAVLGRAKTALKFKYEI